MKLKEIIKQKGFSFSKVAENMGMSRQAFYYKIQNLDRFTVADVKRLRKVLGLTLAEVHDIFEMK